MPKILSVVADLNHIAHPLQKPNLSQPRKPTLVDRIFGVVCLILTVPLTLGILTGLYFYWAKRKVSYIDNTSAKQVDRVMTQIFGNAFAKSQEEQRVSETARSLSLGKKNEVAKHLNSLADDGQLTPPVKLALLEMAIINNQIDMVEELKNRFVSEEFPIEKFPLHKAVSGKMVEELVRLGVPVEAKIDQKERKALHYPSSVEVAKVLIEKGASIDSRDVDGLTPLSTITNPEILREIVKATHSRADMPMENRAKDAERLFFQAFTYSLGVYQSLLEKEPDNDEEIKNLKSNMKALLNEFSSLEAYLRLGDPLLLQMIVDRNVDLKSPFQSGETPLEKVVEQLFFWKIKKRADDSKPLVKKQMDDLKICMRILLDNNGLTPTFQYFNRCLSLGDPEILNQFIDKGVKDPGDHLEFAVRELSQWIDIQRHNPSPFAEKMVSDLKVCVRILLDKGASLELEGGRTAKLLEDAVRCGMHEIVAPLIAKGVELNSGEESPLLENAIKSCVFLPGKPGISEILSDKKKAIDTLLQGGARVSGNSFYFCVQLGDPEFVNLFLTKGVPVDGAAGSVTPLEFALAQLRGEAKNSGPTENWKSIVRQLVAHGAKVDLKQLPPRPFSKEPILNYCNGIAGLEDIQQLLKEKGAV